MLSKTLNTSLVGLDSSCLFICCFTPSEHHLYDICHMYGHSEWYLMRKVTYYLLWPISSLRCVFQDVLIRFLITLSSRCHPDTLNVILRSQDESEPISEWQLGWHPLGASTRWHVSFLLFRMTCGRHLHHIWFTRNSLDILLFKVYHGKVYTEKITIS